MERLIIRHGLSEANNRDNYGKPAFGNPNSPLMLQGEEQARELGRTLEAGYSIDFAHEKIAVSAMLRAQQTAIMAGFRQIHIYPDLNEEKGDTSDDELKTMMAEWRSPQATIEVAERIIDNPPPERIWVTHGLLIATMCKQLGVYSDVPRYVPRFCEIRKLDI